MANHYDWQEHLQLNAYQQAIGIFERTNSLGDRFAYAYKNAAQVFVRWDNHTLARQYLEAANRVDTGGVHRAATYAHLAIDSHYVGDENAVIGVLLAWHGCNQA